MKRSLNKTLAPIGLVLLGVLGAGAVVAPAANAAETRSVTAVTVTPDTVRSGESLQIAVDFRVPATAAAGDVFTLAFPTNYVVGFASTGQLIDSANGGVIADCTITTDKITCTYSSYVRSHIGVSGTGHFVGIAKAANGSAGLDWVDGNSSLFHTDTVILAQSSGFPWGLSKNGQLLDSGNIRYFSGFPGSVLSPNYSTWSDTYDSRLSLVRSSLRVQTRTPVANTWPDLSATEYSVSYDDAHHSFSVTLANPTRDDTLAYRFIYELQPPTFAGGAVFSNSVTAGTQTFDYSFDYYATGGSGSGHAGSVSWTKTDPGNQPLGGATFLIVAPDGSSQTVVDDDAFDADKTPGAFAVTGLGAGVYTITETAAPQGYRLDATPATVTLDDNALTGSAGNFVNAPNPGSLTWTKVDDSGAALGGAEFSLQRPDGSSTTVRDNDSSDENKADGEFAMSGLVWGTYTLTETVAPQGYRLDTTAHTAAISAGQLAGSFGEIVNRPVPTLTTTATDKADGDKTLPASGGTITDQVDYTNLDPGTEYTLDGELMVKDTGKSTGITATQKFTPTAGDASVDIDFTVPSGFENTSLVVFETVSEGAAEVAAHKDIGSAEQTVFVQAAATVVPPKPVVTPPTSTPTPTPTTPVVTPPTSTPTSTPKPVTPPKPVVTSPTTSATPAPTGGSTGTSGGSTGTAQTGSAQTGSAQTGSAQTETATSASETGLADTGSDLVAPIGIAGGLGLLGLVLVTLRRRRTHTMS